MRLLLKMILLGTILLMITSVYHAYPVNEKEVRTKKSIDYTAGGILTNQELIDIFAKQGNDREEINLLLHEYNVSGVVIGPESEGIQLAAKETDEWYKQRQIKDSFNPETLKPFNVTFPKFGSHNYSTYTREELPDNLKIDYDRLWDEYRSLEAKKQN